MKLENLRKFLLEANAAGYASADLKSWVKEKDSSTSINFKNGDFSLHDNFFGGEPYGGRIIVQLHNKPFWMMVYYGWVEEGAEPNSVYKILREALKKCLKNIHSEDQRR